ncbi:MAG: serine/threonine-protein kinase, partial [Planctomycetota bacterium]
MRSTLGTGSLGTVYLAHDIEQDVDVALKILRTDRFDSSAVHALQEEFRTLVAYDHPRIARVFDFGYVESTGAPYYTHEYVEGRPLAPGPPVDQDPRTFLQPILDLLEALESLHQGGVLHLDIHPGNLIESSGRDRGAVLIDSGIHGPLGRSGELGSRTSTASYTSTAVDPPELLRGDPPCVATDLYLAGRLLLYRLTGRFGTTVTLPVEIPSWGSQRTLALERICTKALQARLDRRFSSAAALRRALNESLGSSHDVASPTTAVERTVGRRSELRVIENQLQSLSDGNSGSLAFVGPRGSGKSRLLKEAKTRAQLRGFPVIDLCFSASAASESQLVRTLRRSLALRGHSSSWHRSLAAKHGGSPADRARRAAGLFLSNLPSAAVLILDDIDQADRQSRIFAMALNRAVLEGETRSEATGLLVVLADRDRPEELPAQSCVDVGPLSETEASDWFRGLVHPLK